MPLLLLEQQHRGAGDVEAHEVRRQPHHRPVAALGQLHVALDMDQPPQPLRRGVPEEAALEEAAAEPAEVLARQPSRARRPTAPGSRARGCAARPCAGSATRCQPSAAEAVCRAAPARRAAASGTATKRRAECAYPRPLLLFESTRGRGARSAQAGVSVRLNGAGNGGLPAVTGLSPGFSARGELPIIARVAELLDYLRGDAKQIR